VEALTCQRDYEPVSDIRLPNRRQRRL